MSSRLLARGRRVIERASKLVQLTAVKDNERYAKYRDDPSGFASDILGFEFTPLQRQMAEGLLRAPYRVLAPSANEQGKCVAHDEVMTLWDGSQAVASDLVGGVFKLPTLVDGQVVPVEAYAGWNAVETVYEVTLDDGRKIKRNADHPLWSSEAAFRSGKTPKIHSPGWHRTEDIGVGWVVASACELPVGGDDVLTDDEAKLVGYLIGDGGLTTDTVTFTQKDGAQLDEFRQIVEGMGNRVCDAGRPYHYRVPGDWSKGVVVDKNGKSSFRRHNRVIALMRRLGLMGHGSRSKFVPNEILSASLRQQAVFLSRLFSTDGWACVSKNGCPEIGYGSSSERLARDVQRMLWRFGLRFLINYKPKTDSWTVTTQTGEQVCKFADRIGIYGKEMPVWRAAIQGSERKNGKHLWRHRDALPGLMWSKVKRVRVIDDVQTVAITVPGVETFLTPAYEHNTSGSAAIVLWWFCTRSPSIVITTAPTARQIKDLLWKEMRRLARSLPYKLPFQPKACRIERAADDFADGIATRDSTSFQGQHGPNQLFVFDEATGIDGQFFEAVESMFSPPGHAWLVIFNPTTTDSQVYLEYSATESAQRKNRESSWSVVRMSALDHPNIAAELAGGEPVVPYAMRTDKFARLLTQWSQLLPLNPLLPVGSANGPQVGDVIWPPVACCKKQRDGSLRHPVYGPPMVYRPGPEAEARLLARFPSQGSSAVWGEADWQSACRELDGQEPLPDRVGEYLEIPEIGCDVARFGDDMSATHARVGGVSLLHEEVSKRPVDQTVGRLIEIARWLADWFNKRRVHGQDDISAKDIPIKVDDTGVGGGVTDSLRGQGYDARGINASELPNDREKYPNKRSELWFVTADRARRGEIDFSRLDPETLDQLRRQALTAMWKLDQDGCRVVEKKEDAKKRLKRSPDGMDAVNLAHYVSGTTGPSATTTTTRANWRGR